MTGDKPITVQLDRARAIRWTNRAAARNASLPKPVQFTALAQRRRSLYAICAIIWAALVDRDHEFEAPEDLADYFVSEAQQLAALHAIGEMVKDAFPEKKSAPNSGSSADGPAPSSTPASASPPSTGGG